MRILLYVTTHMSPQHKHRLDKDWYTPHPALARAHVLFYTPSTNWEMLRRSFPNASFLAPPPSLAYKYQQGAMIAMTDNRSLGVFKQYDWIIRLNPDVTICSFNETYRHMTSQYDALVGDCEGRIMTDFTVFRPAALEAPKPNRTCGPHKSSLNAECQMTSQLERSVANGRVRTLYKTPGAYCRMLWKANVMHVHSRRPSCH